MNKRLGPAQASVRLRKTTQKMHLKIDYLKVIASYPYLSRPERRLCLQSDGTADDISTLHTGFGRCFSHSFHLCYCSPRNFFRVMTCHVLSWQLPFSCMKKHISAEDLLL